MKLAPRITAMSSQQRVVFFTGLVRGATTVLRGSGGMLTASINPPLSALLPRLAMVVSPFILVALLANILMSRKNTSTH